MTGRSAPPSPYSFWSLRWLFWLSPKASKSAGLSNELSRHNLDAAIAAAPSLCSTGVRLHLFAHRRADCLFLQSRRSRRIPTASFHSRLVSPALWRSGHLGLGAE